MTTAEILISSMETQRRGRGNQQPPLLKSRGFSASRTFEEWRHMYESAVNESYHHTEGTSAHPHTV